MEKSQQTTLKYKGSLSDYYQQLYDNKVDNLEETDKYVKKHNLKHLYYLG